MNSYRTGRHQRRIVQRQETTMDDEMYCDEPTIASEPIYTGPPTDLELEDDVGEVRVWDDVTGAWIDDLWERDGDTITFDDWPIGPVRVVEMVPVSEYEGGGQYDG